MFDKEVLSLLSNGTLLYVLGERNILPKERMATNATHGISNYKLQLCFHLCY